MTIPHDRLVFALNILEGEPGANRILADMLEEQGDRGLAAWARAKKGKRHKRIDFVLAMLPHKVSLRLASDFLVQSLALLQSHLRQPSRQPPVHPADLSVLIRAAQGVSDWCRGSVSETAISPHLAAIGSVSPWAFGIKDIDQTMGHLRAAFDYTRSADTLLDGEIRSAMHHARESANYSRKVAKAAREISKPVAVVEQWNAVPERINPSQTASRILDDVGWQMDHAKRVIIELLES